MSMCIEIFFCVYRGLDFRVSFYWGFYFWGGVFFVFFYYVVFSVRWGVVLVIIVDVWVYIEMVYISIYIGVIRGSSRLDDVIDFY